MSSHWLHFFTFYKNALLDEEHVNTFQLLLVPSLQFSKLDLNGYTGPLRYSLKAAYRGQISFRIAKCYITLLETHNVHSRIKDQEALK